MYVYCLFCRTQRCDRIAEVLQCCGVDHAFSPKIVGRHRRKGILLDQTYDLLPGYVFVYSEQEWQDLTPYRWVDGLLHHVGRVEDGRELTGADRTFALDLLDLEGCVRPATLIQEGEQVRLQDSFFAGGRGTVTRVDYKRQRARVSFTFDGLDCSVWIAVNTIRL